MSMKPEKFSADIEQLFDALERIRIYEFNLGADRLMKRKILGDLSKDEYIGFLQRLAQCFEDQFDKFMLNGVPLWNPLEIEDSPFNSLIMAKTQMEIGKLIYVQMM